MKLFYVVTFIVLMVAIILPLGLNVRVPEPVAEKTTLRIMEGCLKGVGYIVSRRNIRNSTYYKKGLIVLFWDFQTTKGSLFTAIIDTV